MTPLELFLGNLREAGCDPKPNGSSWHARCPSHEDHTPSLTIGEGDDGRVLLRCHTGCDYRAIAAAIGLRPRDLFPGPAAKREAARGERARARPAKPPTPEVEWGSYAGVFQAQATEDRLSALAVELGVSVGSLRLLGAGWATAAQLSAFPGQAPVKSDAWTFPMWGPARAICGLNVRNTNGAGKWTPKGGKLGLFMPSDLQQRPDPVLLPEGASDTAAALDGGYTAVGRPSNISGAEAIAELLRGRDLVLVGENDQKDDGRWPGRDGAVKVAKQLQRMMGRPPRLLMPPAGCKDLRAWHEQQRAARG